MDLYRLRMFQEVCHPHNQLEDAARFSNCWMILCSLTQPLCIKEMDTVGGDGMVTG
jgi:hypothetical protein